MKKNIYSAVLMFSAILQAAAGAPVKLDFDGASASVPATEGRPAAFTALKRASGISLKAAPEPAAGKRWGPPEVPSPTCVDGCDGADGNGGEQPYTPPAPAPHPAPVPSPAPQPVPWTPPQPVVAPALAPPTADFLQKPFAASVCLAIADGATDCRTGSGKDVLNKFEASVRKDIIEELGLKAFALVFPAGTNPAGLYGVLKTVAQYGIQQLELSLQEDLTRMLKEMETNGNWGTPVAKARMVRIIVNNEQLLKLWKEAALLEAEAGSNWAKTGPASYQFKGGPAYEQLRDGLRRKEIFTGQSGERRPKRAR